jgi:hypothetical protein
MIVTGFWSAGRLTGTSEECAGGPNVLVRVLLGSLEPGRGSGPLAIG